MADFFPFDSGPGSNVTEAQWNLMAKNWLGTGVIKGAINEFQVYADSSGMVAKVKSGQAWVEGFFFQVVTETIIPISAANATNPRIDRIAVQVDWTNNNISLIAIQGTPATSPTAPALTQNTSIWQMSLAQVYVAANATTITAGNITDERNFVKNANAIQPSWLSLTFQNGWVNYGYEYQTAQYRLNNFGTVELRGRITAGTTTAGTVIATLPSGYRPPAKLSFSIVTNNTTDDQIGQIDIDSSGNIIVIRGFNTYLSLDGIRFSTI